MTSTAAAGLVRLLADPGLSESWDGDVASVNPHSFGDFGAYALRLAEAQERTGQTEAIWTGAVSIGGRPVALVACNFGFLGGSMGVVAGERVAHTFERAGREGLPMVAVVASGGVRMQEGVVAFMQMVKTADAAWRFRQAGGRYVVYLAGPATGGVLASWASLGQVTLAAPGAFVGLSGPRVLEATAGQALPDHAQRAEQFFEWGLVDELVPQDRIRCRLIEVLAALMNPPEPAGSGVTGDVGRRSLQQSNRREPWAVIEASRNPTRPGAEEVLTALGGVAVSFRGDGGGGGDDPGCLAGLLRLRGRSVMVVAQLRDRDGPASLGPAGYRKARRAMVLAEELGMPFVTLIDTSGGESSIAAEKGGMAAEVARCLATMMSLSVPTVAVLLGPGTGAGAIALVAADRVVAAEQSWLGPLAPEGASALMYRTSERAAEVASAQRVVAADLACQGIVDTVVAEMPDAAVEPAAFAYRLAAEVLANLDGILGLASEERIERRRWRYRALGLKPHRAREEAASIADGGIGSALRRVQGCRSGSRGTNGGY